MDPDWDIEHAPFGMGTLINERWLLDYGRDPDGDRGASVTDMRPEQDDLSEVQYAFKWSNGMMVLHLVGLHRHQTEGECEHLLPEELDWELPDMAREVVMEFSDAPVMTKTKKDSA